MGLPIGAAGSGHVLTHCPYCSLQCGVRMRSAGPRRPSIEPSDFPTNRGGLCSKGWSAAELLDHPDRLTTPLVRTDAADRGSPLRAASWVEVLNRIVAAIRRSQEAYGHDSVGCFGGGGLTNEKGYQLGKFARVALRTPNIDYNGRFCMSSAATAGYRAFGVDRGLPFPLADIAGAQAILLAGSNPADTMPPAMQYLDAGRAAGAAHIVVDPRRSATARGSALHLQPAPGTDLAIANGMLHIALREGYVDADYVSARTTGFAAVRDAAGAYWPDRVERITGVGVAQLREAVRLLGTARSAMVITARGAEQHSSGTDTAQAYINLALALGLPGKPFSGYGTVTGQGNGQGGREHGQKCDQLPGYRRIDDPAARAHVAAVWGIDPGELPGPGKSAMEMLDRLGTPGGVRVLLVLASNIVVSAPDRNRVLERLRALDFLVVCDIFLSETAAEADVVLPAAQWAEEEGTMTNLEGRVLRRKQVLPPPEGVVDDLTLLAALAGGWDAARTSRPTRGWSSRSCAGPARAGSPTTPASPMSGSRRSRASSGRVRPRTTRVRRGCSRRRSPRRTGAPASSAWTTATPPRCPTPTTRTCSRPAASCNSIKAATRPGGLARFSSPRATRASSCIRTWPGGTASWPATWSSYAPGGAGRCSGRT